MPLDLVRCGVAGDIGYLISVEFLRGGGQRVIICLPQQLDAALKGKAGTTVLS